LLVAKLTVIFSACLTNHIIRHDYRESFLIFLSHNHNDKPLIEHVAIKLSAAFGQSNVFYDSWSIQPGEGIIDKMSEALGQCTHFFFFVSADSLKSRMVSLEWQNALLKATKGQCRLVAVRCDASELPPIMAQSLYIDLYSVGLEAAVAQIADVVRGGSTYRQPTQPFSNLCFSATGTEQDFTIEVKARFYLEPIANFLVLVDNSATEFEMKPVGEDPFRGGFNENVRLSNGTTSNGFVIAVFRGITPPMPLRIQVKAKQGIPIRLRGVLHQTTPERWDPVPPEVNAILFPGFGFLAPK